jgi:5-methylcytosine-specific restriction enzyme A
MSQDDRSEQPSMFPAPTDLVPANNDMEAGRLPRALPPHLQALVDLLPLDVPVHRSTIEAHYTRSNYARRIRKIVAEYGWSIETFRGSNGANDDWYTRRSDGPVRRQQLRREVPPAVRRQVYARDNWTCQICGASVGEGPQQTPPQCDHKVPFTRGGQSGIANLQTICIQCNLKKRQTCRACQLATCQGCPLAYPERLDGIFVLALTPEASVKLRSASVRDGASASALISRLIDDNLATK